MATFGAAAPDPNPNKDILVSDPPNDGISSIAFSPAALAPKNFLVAGTWDNEVRCWEIQASGQTTAVGMIKHDGPVLAVAWSQDGQAIFSGGCDKTAKMWSPSTNQSVPVAQHDAPIRHLFYTDQLTPGAATLVTGSWDKTIKYWDIRAPTGTPMGQVPLPERLYAMDTRGPLLVAATAERHILVYDIRKPTTPFKQKPSQLKYQIRCVATFPDQTGFAVGSVEGRVSLDYVQPNDESRQFAFKCHRENDTIYAVNAIKFHDGFGTFATAGSDGGISFWDKESKQRLHKFPVAVPQPITSATFNHDGSIFGYAVSYDWSKGAENHNPATAKNYILLHGVKETEIKPKKPAPKR